MANLGFQFKAEEVPTSEYEPIPAGEYVCMFTESELKDTAAGTGQYIQIKLEVVEGDNAGRTLIERLNIKNPNEKAVEIAYQTLAKICNAVNKPNIQNTEELHNIRLIAKVDVQKSKPYIKDGVEKEGNLQNVIKGYKSITEKASAHADSSPQGGDAKLPWQK
jgi:hypothetical protein